MSEHGSEGALPRSTGSAPLRVFLSHTSELREHPVNDSFIAAAERAVNRSGSAITDMAYFTAREGRPAAYCRQQVEQADVYVGVIGFRYGSAVSDEPDVSYTELEFDTATQRAQPRLVFLLDENATLPLPRSFTFDPQFEDRQQAFRSRLLAAGVIVQRVTSPKDLELMLFQALTEVRRDKQAQETQTRINSGLALARQPVQREVVRRVRFVNPPPMVTPGWFQDRHLETGLMGEFLREDGRRWLTILGRGGIGKTAMVCRLLKALEAGRLPEDGGELSIDGIVYLSPTGDHHINFPDLFADLTRLLPIETADRLLERYRAPAHTPEQLMAGLLDAFPAGRTVVLLDNFEDLIDSATGTVTDPVLDEALRQLLLGAQHGVKVIATSRLLPRDLVLAALSRHQRLDLDTGLPTAEAITVLRHLDPTGEFGLRDAPVELLTEAAEHTRGFPRALEALTAILAAGDATLPELLTRTQGVVPDRIVEVLVADAYAQLDPLAQQVMQALAIFHGPIPPVAVDFLLQPFRPAINCAPVLNRLVTMHFARRETNRFYLHPVDRDYALSRIPAGEPADPHAATPPFTQVVLLDRAADYFAQTRTLRETWRTLEDLAAQLSEFELRYAGGDYDTAADVIWDIDFDYLQPWGHYRLVVAMRERLQPVLQDPEHQADNATGLGISYATLGETGKAIQSHQRALRIYRQVGNRDGEAAALGNLGLCFDTLGQTDKSIDFQQRALTIYREIGNRRGEAAALGNLGLCYRILGQIPEAIEQHRQALNIYRDTGNRDGEAAALGNLGQCYRILGQVPAAIEQHRQALTIARDTGNRDGEAAALGNLGQCYRILGEIEEAIEQHQQALSIRRETGNRDGEAAALGNLGLCYSALGQNEKAIEQHQQALTIARQTGNRDDEAKTLGSLGLCYDALGHTENAIDHHVQALVIDRETGNRDGEASDLSNLGLCYATLGHIEKAIDHHQRALTIVEDTGSLYEQGLAHVGIGDSLWISGNSPSEARGHYQTAIKLGESSSNTEILTGARLGLARVYLDEAEWAQARQHAGDAIADGYRPSMQTALVVQGIAALRMENHIDASGSFASVLATSGQDSVGTTNLQDCYAEALATAGQVVIAGDDPAKAKLAFESATALSRAEGLVTTVVRQFDMIAAVDSRHVLRGVRQILRGD